MNARPLALLILAAAIAAGCKVDATTRPTPKGPAVGVTDKRLADVSTLTGKVKIIADNGAGIIADNGAGIISQDGGSIISDNGAGVISNNSGNLVANNGGNILGNNGSSLVANNGGGLTSKVKRDLLATPKPREFFLADAQVTVLDAAGKPVLDAAGKPITATTDASGAYTLTAPLPAGNLVLKIQVHEGGLLSGGELTAMLPKRQPGAQSAAIDTLSSLGAAYVLGKYVKGDQKTFDKLPAAEADKLRASLDGARALVTATPRYRPDDLAALTEQLRAKAPAVNQTLEEIQALLIGQSGGGDGQRALNAAMAAPIGMALGPAGELYVGEPTLGRIRKVGLDGRIGTLADTVRGQIKRNFPHLQDLVTGKDGTIYVCAESQVFKITPDGQAIHVAGTQTKLPYELAAKATETGIAPRALAVGADGTLYIGEGRGDNLVSRVLAVDAGGGIRQLNATADWDYRQNVCGLEVEPDGSVDVLLWAFSGDNKQRIKRLAPGKPTVQLAESSAAGARGGDLARGPDGTLYASFPTLGQIFAYDAAGVERLVAGVGGPAGTTEVSDPRTLLCTPDGTLLIADHGANVIRALGPDGRLTLRAGTTNLVQSEGDLRSLALNGPSGAVYDAQDRLVVAEAGGYRLERFAGGTLDVFAGDGVSARDGGPKAPNRLQEPRCITRFGDTLYFFDDVQIRAIGPDGVVRTLAGNNGEAESLAPGDRVPAAKMRIAGYALAVAPDGRVYAGTNKNRIVRLEPDGTLTLVAGKPHESGIASGPDGAAALLDPNQGDGGPATAANFNGVYGLAFDAKGDLLVVDSGNFRIRKITGLTGATPMIKSFMGMPLTKILEHSEDKGEPAPETLTAETIALLAPMAVAVDGAGNTYVSDAGVVALPYLSILVGSNYGEAFQALPEIYSHVFKLTPEGKISVVAGNQGKFFKDPTAEDGLVLPLALATSADGRLAIVDGGSNLIRILPAHAF